MINEKYSKEKLAMFSVIWSKGDHKHVRHKYVPLWTHCIML